jgi:U2 small nuclear ribonucleoprotein A'
VVQDQDAIDFTDNDISSLSNFPFFPRLRMLLLARNRVRQIQPTIATSIPGLTTLVLTQNNIAELADLDPLRNLTRLTHLTLLENPVTRKEVRTIIDSSYPYLSFLHRARVKLTDLLPSTTASG